MKLAGQVAIVTGGGRGIGHVISKRLAAEGVAVTVSGTGRKHLDTTVDEIKAAGGRAIVSLTDVSDEAAVKRLIAETLAAFGRIDILVNNAGISGPTAPIVKLELAEWERTLAVNTTGAFLCAKHALPGMIERRAGRIVNITSVAGRIGYALRSPYAVSKWGMIALTRSLALEVGEFGITVNAIAPGAVRGERIGEVVRARAEATGQKPEDIEWNFFTGTTALKRLVEPEEIAATTVFLCSEEARNITGETLGVSAGFRV